MEIVEGTVEILESIAENRGNKVENKTPFDGSDKIFSRWLTAVNKQRQTNFNYGDVIKVLPQNTRSFITGMTLQLSIIYSLI